MPSYPVHPHDPERVYVSKSTIEKVGLVVNVAGAPTDVTGSMSVTMVNEETDGTVFTRLATRVDVGTYELTLSTIETGTPGYFTLRWSFTLGSVPQIDETPLEIGERAPSYDRLDEGLKAIVESVYSVRMGDLFDSDLGGPNLQTYYQTHFGRNRVAQLLKIAVGRLNTISQPHQTYSIDPPNIFPIEQWGALLEQALYVETMKHLRRSYVEQPAAEGVSTARLDRRDYMSRWGEIIDDEEKDLDKMLDTFKIASLGLGRGRVLVGGGVFGSYAPTRAGGLATRPRYWARWY